MRKPSNAQELAIDILERSECSVRVGAVIKDKTGIVSWGWNSPGPDGMGMHAEAHAISRANKKRLYGATIYVASVRGRNGKSITSKPCVDCQHLITKWNLKVTWRDSDEYWR